jgi:hypothetical protein
MSVGNIYTVDDEDPDFHAFCYRDYSMGSIIYWELEDEDTTVFIRADNEEIVYYEHTGWLPGSMSEPQILSQAQVIAIQFASLPPDKENPEAHWLDSVISIGDITQEGDDDATSLYSYWEVTYNRTKENIPAEDHIRVLLLPNGYCSLYCKEWNMDLDTFSTSYIISQSQAQSIALAFVGGSSTVEDIYKLILRPNNFWGEDLEFGNNPCCAWVVYVHDEDDNLCVVHVDGNTGEVIGGDAIFNCYGP